MFNRYSSDEIELKNAASQDLKTDEKDNKSNGCLRNGRKYLTTYLQEGNIHGLKYLAERRTAIEKIWWLIALIVALYGCITLILLTYKKWETSPVIVSFATKETPIFDIPFPTVTICPEVKSRTTIFNYTDILYKKQDGVKLDNQTELQFAYMSEICTFHKELKYPVPKYFDNSIYDFYQDVSPNFYDDVSDCMFMGSNYNCSDIFKPIVVDEGLCYAFNLLDRSDMLNDNVAVYKNLHKMSDQKAAWSLNEGYTSLKGRDIYPKRALYAGALFSLELKFKVEDKNLDFTCGTSIQGYKIQIHQPSMLPRPKNQHFRIPLDQSVIAAVMPNMITTSEAVKNYSPSRRKCYFSSERTLKYFKTYTQQNCQIECITNYTLHECGCVDFYMPREANTPICGTPMKGCVKKADDDRLEAGINAQLSEKMGLKYEPTRAYKQTLVCDCMPECTFMSYIVENSQSDWDWERKYQMDRNSPSYNKSTTHMSYLQVFFKSNQFITSDRNELYGVTDFLANFGGLLGLFTGFSALSLVEILYFLTLRIICNIKLYGRRHWYGEDK
ncbi:unnamed protein product [Brassicogethes aeneus]|uniref:Uncharacterized protein n=1 Tax=Brassicogethes aeneus TaxID=1431903 RepID=A0A9P0FQM7_BRAAE|nr:unnamed protein product [Brassicogethes aeneus]